MSENQNKITVKEFVEKYNQFGSEQLKQNYLKTMLLTDYLLYEKKIAICEQIVKSSYYRNVKSIDGTDRKELHINSTANYVLYCLNLVDNYTKIKIDFKNVLDDFNALNRHQKDHEYSYLDILITLIPDYEVKEFRMILDMAESDFIQNEYEIHSFIRNQVERFGQLTGVTLTPMLDKLAESLDKLDDKSIDKLLNGLKAFNKNNKFKITK